jgi:hypothetical protein
MFGPVLPLLEVAKGWSGKLILMCWLGEGKTKEIKRMHRPGIEPGAGRHQKSEDIRWQRPILPLNHQCYSMIAAASNVNLKAKRKAVVNA